ncbi:hypothetical protein BHM03_00059319, partial [Ensete ventricosum]
PALGAFAGGTKNSATIRRWIFPVAVFGSESVMNTLFGTLNAARFFRQCLTTSASSISASSLGTTAQFICNPSRVPVNIPPSVGEPMDQILTGRRAAYLFPVLVVRHPERHRLRDVGMLQQHRIHLYRRDLLACDQQ